MKLATTVSSHFYCTCPQKDFVSTRHIAQSDSGLRNRDALQACTRGLVNHWDEIYFLQLALLGHLVVEGHCEGEARLRSEVIRQIVWEPLNATEYMTHFIALGMIFFSILTHSSLISIMQYGMPNGMPMAKKTSKRISNLNL